MKPTDVADAILGAPAPPIRLPGGVSPATLIWGVVASIQNGPPPSLTVTLAGSATQVAGVRFLSSYRPVANDTVAIAQVGSDLVVMDSVASSLTIPRAGMLQALATMTINAAQTVNNSTVAGFNGKVGIDPLSFIKNNASTNCIFQIPNGWPTLYYWVEFTVLFNVGTCVDIRPQMVLNPSGANTNLINAGQNLLAGNFPGARSGQTIVQLAAGDQIQPKINNADGTAGHNAGTVNDGTFGRATIGLVGGW